jgi:hypothetical protein
VQVGGLTVQLVAQSLPLWLQPQPAGPAIIVPSQPPEHAYAFGCHAKPQQVAATMIKRRTSFMFPFDIGFIRSTEIATDYHSPANLRQSQPGDYNIWRSPDKEKT